MLIKYVKKYATLIVGQLFFASLWVFTQLMIPRYMVDIIDVGFMMKDMNVIINRGFNVAGNSL